MTQLLPVYRIDETIDTAISLDVKDEKILALLSMDARMPISAIAKQIRLSKEGTFYRIKRLQEKGILLQFLPVVDLRDFGYATYHVFFVINEANLERRQELMDAFLAHPHTKGLIEYSDRWDFEWILVARHVQEFDALLTDLTKAFTDIIVEKHKFEIITGFKSIQFPQTYVQEKVMLKPKKVILKQLDAKDYLILTQLADNARASTYTIAAALGFSPDTVRLRMKKLLAQDIIRQFTILPCLSRLGYHWQTLCIDVKTFDLPHELKFKEYISQKPEIIRAVKVLGDWDLMLYIVTKNMSQAHKLIKEIQKTFVDIIITYQTFGEYREHYFTSLPFIIQNAVLPGTVEDKPTKKVPAKH
ncbi:Lrp/AsnC family transcriptional regulator [Candidatus Woesearchaeota archaeon]|nr:Lrp/AsnC family transcriptional regulator [Candidatus Woesearchaeota archaeon]